MMNICSVTMMFGAAMPLLFPIAFFSFAILYVQDIVLVIYYAQKPPEYNDAMHN